MGLRFGGFSVAVAGVALAFAGCHDYDEFTFVEQGGSAGTVGGTSGSGGTVGGNGGTIGVGGAGGTVTGGTGGITTGGAGGATGGTAGAGGAGGAGGSTGCPTGQKTCNGTCVNTNDPAFGCAATVCDPCVIANAEVQCAPSPTPPSPACALLKCNTGFFNCNTDLTDGCEQTIDTVAHCGSCNRACDTTESTAATCSASKCVHTCNAGFGDCSQPLSPVADNGCETNFNTSATSCGACGNNCASQGLAPGFVCNAGACGCSTNEQCKVGGDASAAVCNTTTGVCSCSGTTCDPGEACIKSGPSSVCRCNGTTDCTSGQTCCPTTGCKNLQTDSANCGGCGKVCPTGTTCTAGSCV
jgi:hypothetical protein